MNQMADYPQSKENGLFIMESNQREKLKKIMEDLRGISYINPADVPNIELYMDQVTTFMDQHLESTKRYTEDKLLTKTMINNYTKNDLLPSPNKKKYSKDHMLLLVFIYYLKNILSITDIQALLHPLTEMFFSGKGEVSLEEIYKEVFEMEHSQAAYVTKDMLHKATVAEQSFTEIEDENQRDYLQNFAYACLLSYDIYMKRQMLERLIDEQFSPKQVSPKQEKEAGKKADKNPKK